MIKKFNDFNLITEKVKLTDDEKNYLWSKLEYRKKKNALETENELFDLLKGDKKSFNEEEFNNILNSLEFGFRKKLKRFEKPIDNEYFMSISDKIPEEWVAVKYSSLKSREKK